MICGNISYCPALPHFYPTFMCIAHANIDKGWSHIVLVYTPETLETDAGPFN